MIRPRYFALQWHITAACNWRCRHCYQEGTAGTRELSLKEMKEVFRQYRALIRGFGTIGPKRTRLVIAGGEPLLSEKFFPFLEYIRPYNREFLLTVLSNGSLVTPANAARMRRLGVKMFQVSLEGLQRHNDGIRGKGAFKTSLKAAKTLESAGINTVACVTLTRRNQADIPELLRTCARAGISQAGVRRLVAIGRAKEMRAEMLQPAELRRFYRRIEKLRVKKGMPEIAGGCDESVFCQELDRPLINCGVTEGRMLTVLPDGSVTACRRLPLIAGHALKQGLSKIYYSSRLLRGLRNLNNAYAGCRECPEFGGCLSGARCVAHAYFGKLSAPDPQCWRLFGELPSPALLKNQKEQGSRDEMLHFTLMPGLFRYV